MSDLEARQLRTALHNYMDRFDSYHTLDGDQRNEIVQGVIQSIDKHYGQPPEINSEDIIDQASAVTLMGDGTACEACVD